MKIRILTGVVGFGRNLKPGEIVEVNELGRRDALILIGIRAAEEVKSQPRRGKRERSKKSV